MHRKFLILLTPLLLTAFPVLAADSSADRLAQAVQFKTISYQDRALIQYSEFERFHEFLRSSFPRAHTQLQVEAVNTHSLLYTWPGSDPTLQPVLFTAHMDVVPVEPGTEKDWQHPAFAGVVADGRIYGRGTLDDKQGLLGLLEAAESLLAEGFSPERTLVFAFGHDEEISGKHGASKLAQRMRDLGLHFEWMVDEGGMLISDNAMMPDKTVALVNVAEKGYLTLTLTATGQGGHSSRPPKVSTIGRLANALARIEANPFPTRLVGPVEAMLETMAPHVAQPERFVFNNLWLTAGIVARQMSEDPDTNSFVRTTTALTMINAGVKENVIPQRAEAKVNFRLLPGDTPESVIKHITAVVDDPRIEISHDDWDNIPGVADYEGVGFQVIEAAVGAVYEDAVVVPSLLTATTDTRHYIDLVDNQYRFHGVSMDSTQTTSIHGTDEYITVDSYQRSIEIARHLLTLASR